MKTTTATILVLGTLVGVAGCGGSSSSPTSSDAQSSTTAKYSGVTAATAKPVPPLKLLNYNGKPVNIDQYRGKAVLVTFIYDHCPDICPLIVSHLHEAQNELGPEAKNLQIIAVSVDPKGDTPKTVKDFLKVHQMTGRMEYLLGSRNQLENVWTNWNIRSRSAASKSTPDVVEHSALIYGISGTGKITTLYPANFKPQQIVHDVPLLAAS